MTTFDVINPATSAVLDSAPDCGVGEAKQAIERTAGNLTQAAKLLEISRDQLRYKLKKAGVYDSQEME